jgi:hypothetical protein
LSYSTGDRAPSTNRSQADGLFLRVLILILRFTLSSAVRENIAGAGTAMFAMVNGVLPRPLRNPNASRLTMVWERKLRARMPESPVSRQFCGLEGAEPGL